MFSLNLIVHVKESSVKKLITTISVDRFILIVSIYPILKTFSTDTHSATHATCVYFF